MKVRKIIINFSEVIKFSHFFVVGFLRIEGLHSFLYRKRDYYKYSKIPMILLRYLELATDEEKIEWIDANFKSLNEGLYKKSWDEISNIKINGKNINNEEYDKYETYIDKLNYLLNDKYGVEDKKFFSSISIINKEINVNEDLIDSEIYIINSLTTFFGKFIKINRQIKKYENKDIKKKETIKDLKVCRIIISTEFSNFLHHIYVAYHKSSNKIKKIENITKGLNHLKRASSDAEKAFVLSKDCFDYTVIKKRLEEISQVGM